MSGRGTETRSYGRQRPNARFGRARGPAELTEELCDGRRDRDGMRMVDQAEY